VNPVARGIHQAVEEDALGNATGNLDNNPDGDLTTGNLDAATQTDKAIAAAGSLTSLVL
jgi:hypothetical protein